MEGRAAIVGGGKGMNDRGLSPFGRKYASGPTRIMSRIMVPACRSMLPLSNHPYALSDRMNPLLPGMGKRSRPVILEALVSD